MCSQICKYYDDWYQGYPPFKLKRIWFRIRDWRWDLIILYFIMGLQMSFIILIMLAAVSPDI